MRDPEQQAQVHERARARRDFEDLFIACTREAKLGDMPQHAGKGRRIALDSRALEAHGPA